MSEEGGVPVGWLRAPLGEVVEILDGRRIPVNASEREKRPGKVPYYGATGQVGWIDDYLFNEELVLLGEDGAPFLDGSKQKAYIIRGKTWVNNHAHVLRTLGGMPSLFLKHQLDQVQYLPYVSGTTRLKLPQGPMKQIELWVPPEQEQKRLVEAIERELSKLDDAVANLKRVRANLKRYRASVLKAAVEGRLVPTEAELARREGRTYEPASELLKRILKERRERFVEAHHDAPSRRKGKYVEPVEPDTSGLPELPEGWVWVSVDQLVSVGTGATPKIGVSNRSLSLRASSAEMAV
jgi:type I restriction enzyme S subunit